MPHQKAMVASRVKTLAWKTLCCRQWLYFWLKPSFWTVTVLRTSGFGVVGTLLCFLLEKTQESIISTFKNKNLALQHS